MNIKNEYICEICGKEFSRKESLSRHVNYTHKHLIQQSSKHKCKLCGKEISKKTVLKHLKTTHNFTDKQSFLYLFNYSRKEFSNISEDIRVLYLNTLYELNHGSELYSKQFNSFYNMILKIRQFNKDDIKNFFNNVLPYKKQHKTECNSKRLCDVVFKGEPENSKLYYEKYMMSLNPFKNHGGKFSPFSDSFIGYIGMDSSEIKKRKYAAGKYDKIGRNQNQKEYWLKRGYSESDAIIEARKHINTFSLEKCIEKYGLENGYKIWKERQEKWQSTLRSKPVEEQERINHNKVYKNGPKSGVESEFLNKLSTDISKHNKYLQNLGVIVDFIQDNKIIEFYGDYWHCNPKQKRFVESYYHPYLKMTAKEKWEFDENRINKLKNSGYKVKIVWESDYKENKDSVILDCKKFLGE